MDPFTKALFQAMEEAESAFGIRQPKLRLTAEKYGGIAAAKYYIDHSRISDGFDALHQKKRLDLSMEALVTSTAFHGLFTDDEVNECFVLLCGADYYQK